MKMNIHRLKVTGVFLATFLIVSACSGSSYDGSSPTPPPPVGGITRTGLAFSSGPVTAFGSVVVNGVRYDTSGANFTVDGQVATQADLAVGDMIVVKGTIDDDNTNAVADSVDFDDNVEGPITAGSINTTAGSLIVMGQLVIVGANTSYDDSISPASLDGLADDDIIEVSGYVESDGTIHATRIEDKPTGGEFEITGTVTAASAGATTFEIGNLTVDFSGVLMLEDFPGSRSVETGDLVEAKGSLNTPTLLMATSVEFKGDRLLGDDGDHIEIEGFITSYDSDLDFKVSNDVMVSCGSGCTVTTEDRAGGALGLNLKVEVKGEYDGGVLIATSVDIRLGNAVRFTALLEDASVVGNTGSLILMGATFNVDNRTRFEDKSGQAVEFSSIDQLSMGDYIAVRGQEDGSGGLFAVIVELEELADPNTVFDTIIQGFLDADPAAQAFPPLNVLDVVINSNAGTAFRDEFDNPIPVASDFFNQLRTGSLIKAKGTQVSGSSGSPPVTLLAEEIELQIE
ncbi:MAG: hypothetical protein ACI88G_001531 [Woeseiaceae bacterium]|jgi:hypothetical protein